MSQLDTDKTIDGLFEKLSSDLEGVFASSRAKIKASLNTVAASGDLTRVALALVQEIECVQRYSKAVLSSAKSNAPILASGSPLTRFLSQDTLPNEEVKEVLQGLISSKLSQAKIASAIGTDQPRVSRVLRGDCLLTSDQRTKLLEFLREELVSPSSKQ